MILLTGAAGKTGKAILHALSEKGAEVKAFVRSQQQADSIRQLGTFEVVIGDLRDAQSLDLAMKNVKRVYYICPNVTPDEVEIGSSLINLAKKHGIEHFVYHSVLHSQVEEMPHHWQKMRMEEQLFKSGMDFTILQPCAYMQNIFSGLKKIDADGKYVVPYRVSARLSIVDLNDIASVAAKVLTENDHANAIYELAGPEPLSQVEVAERLAEVLGHPVAAVEQPRQEWMEKALTGGQNELQVSTLLKMFEYYDKYGLVGNSIILEYLLGRKPATFKQALIKIMSSGEFN